MNSSYKPLAKKRTANFREDETRLLIQLWGSPQIQNRLNLTHRKAPVMRLIAANMQQRGFYRSPDEIKTRIRNLKCLYHRIKRTINSGTGIGTVDPDWPHFQAMDAILGDSNSNHEKDHASIIDRNVFKEHLDDLIDGNIDIKQEIDINDDIESWNGNESLGSDYDDDFPPASIQEPKITITTSNSPIKSLLNNNTINNTKNNPANKSNNNNNNASNNNNNNNNNNNKSTNNENINTSNKTNNTQAQKTINNNTIVTSNGNICIVNNASIPINQNTIQKNNPTILNSLIQQRNNVNNSITPRQSTTAIIATIPTSSIANQQHTTTITAAQFQKLTNASKLTATILQQNSSGTAPSSTTTSTFSSPQTINLTTNQPRAIACAPNATIRQSGQSNNIALTPSSIPLPFLILNNLSKPGQPTQTLIQTTSPDKNGPPPPKKRKENLCDDSDGITDMLSQILDVQKQNLATERQRLEVEKQRLEFDRLVGGQLLTLVPMLGSIIQRLVYLPNDVLGKVYDSNSSELPKDMQDIIEKTADNQDIINQLNKIGTEEEIRTESPDVIEVIEKEPEKNDNVVEVVDELEKNRNILRKLLNEGMSIRKKEEEERKKKLEEKKKQKNSISETVKETGKTNEEQVDEENNENNEEVQSDEVNADNNDERDETNEDNCEEIVEEIVVKIQENADVEEKNSDINEEMEIDENISMDEIEDDDESEEMMEEHLEEEEEDDDESQIGEKDEENNEINEENDEENDDNESCVLLINENSTEDNN